MSETPSPQSPASPTPPRDSSHLGYSGTTVTSKVPQPYAGMTEKQLLQTIAVDSERTAIATEKLLALQSPSPVLDPAPSLPSEAPSTVIPDSPADVPTTPPPPASPTTEFKLPEQLKSIQGDGDYEVLANGYTVPRYLIEVLNDFDKVAPGATVYEARPAVVAQILSAHSAKVATSTYPFCLNDDASIPDKGSPCILRKGHRGRHKDNDDGSWP